MNSATIVHLPEISIGEATMLYGLTFGTIRFYEERGLIVITRDRRNNRYFNGDLRRRLGWIASLRRSGLGLKEIREVLEAEDAGGRGREVALEKLDAWHQVTQTELARIELAAAILRGEPTTDAELVRLRDFAVT